MPSAVKIALLFSDLETDKTVFDDELNTVYFLLDILNSYYALIELVDEIISL